MNSSMTTSDPTGGDKVAYFGVINVNENGRTIGSLDIWRSLLTKEMFCEEKRLGILEIVDYIGMPRIDKEKKWAVAISGKERGICDGGLSSLSGKANSNLLTQTTSR